MNEKIVPYDYQGECIEALTNHFEAGNQHALVVMATGLGKTLTMAFYLELWFQAGDGRILFLLDQSDPLFQAHQEFDRVLGPLGITYGFWTGEKKTFQPKKCNVIFSTFQCMQLHLHRFEADAFDLLIVDEAHHSQATNYRAVIEHFSTAQRIGITATPERGDGKDILDLFGKMVYELPLVRALAERRLAQVDYRLHVDNIDLEKLQEMVEKINGGDRKITRRDIDETIFIPERMECIAEKVRAAQNGTKKTIIFCKSQRHLEEVQKVFPNAKPYHSEVPRAERKIIYKAFRSGKLREVLVIDMFNEAIDIPSAEVLVFLRSTNSKRILLQQLGRGLRGAHKTVTVLDFVANVERINTISELNWETAQGTDGGDDEGPDLKPGLQVHGNLNINFSEEIIDLLKVLSWISSDFYPTYDEAKAAVQKLTPVPDKYKEYQKIYRQDSRLTSVPEVTYADVWKKNGGWPGFLGKGVRPKFYPTYDEAKAAVQKLNPVPKSANAYLEVYKLDPRLPSNPQNYYADVWKQKGSWLGFFHHTYDEAKAAIQKLSPVPKSEAEYRQELEQDTSLPLSPEYIYADVWKKNGGWPGFLGTQKAYYTYAEAKAAVQKLKPVPKEVAEYDKVYKKDTRLPSNPNKIYFAIWKQNGGWPGFLGTKKS